MKKINRVTTDWFFSQETGEEYKEWITGQKMVKEITAHFAQGEGDKCWITIIFDDGSSSLLFNIHSINYEKL